MARRWKFGIDQTSKQERAEIRTALRDGRGDEYVRGQFMSKLIEQETSRRRARHGKVER